MPPHAQAQVLALLAKKFEVDALVSGQDLISAGFNVEELVELGWLKKTPGRWSTTYMAGREVREQMLFDYVGVDELILPREGQ